MPRINTNQQPDNKSQELLAGVQKALGKTPNIFTTLAHSSSALGFMLAGMNGFTNSKLSPQLREQIALTMAGMNGCDYCASAHTAIGKMNKIDENEMTQNLSGQSSDSKTQAALNFVRQVVETRGHVSNNDMTAIRNAGYGDSEIMDMIALIALNTLTNYTNSVAQTTVDFPHVNSGNALQAA